LFFHYLDMVLGEIVCQVESHLFYQHLWFLVDCTPLKNVENNSFFRGLTIHTVFRVIFSKFLKKNFLPEMYAKFLSRKKSLHFYKPFYAFDRFMLRDVYFSLWGNLVVHSYLRFQATDLHNIGLVWKMPVRSGF
jgi:hypothetical protein